MRKRTRLEMKRTGGRKPIRRRATKSGAPRPKAQDTSSTGQAAYSWWQIYEAADRRDFRGWFFFPNLSPSEQLTSLSRRAIQERSDWLYKNVGAVTMVIDGLSLDEVGSSFWPKWQTANRDFNRAITNDFHYANHDPRVFSADAQNDYYSVQYNIRRAIRLYGDCFGQLLRPTPGTVMPSHHLVPGYLVDNSGREKPDDGWHDGVLTNNLGRPLQFRVLKNEHPENENDCEDFDAEDLLHYHDPFLPGQRRGVPVLAPVAKKLFRREDIAKALANGTLARERLGFAIEYVDDSTGKGPTILAGATEITEEENTKTNVDGSTSKGRLVVQKFFGDPATDDVPIPEIPNGGKIKMLESNRPGTAVMEFQDSILREVAYASNRPPEYIYDLAGIGQGTLARLVIEKVRIANGCAREFQLKPQFCNRYNVFYAWQRIKVGAFDNVAGGIPDDWWKQKMVPPRDATVDIGREGRLYDERYATNRMSISAYHGLNGEDDEDVEDELYAVVERRCSKINLLNETESVKTLGQKFGYFDLHPPLKSAGVSFSTTDMQPPPDQPPPRKNNNNRPPGSDRRGGRNNNRNGHQSRGELIASGSVGL